MLYVRIKGNKSTGLFVTMAEAKRNKLPLPGMELSSESDDDEQYGYDSDKSVELPISKTTVTSTRGGEGLFKQAIFANCNLQFSAG